MSHKIFWHGNHVEGRRGSYCYPFEVIMYSKSCSMHSMQVRDVGLLFKGLDLSSFLNTGETFALSQSDGRR